MKNKKVTIFLLVILAFAAGVMVYTIKSSGRNGAATSLKPVGVTETGPSGQSAGLENPALAEQGAEILRLLSVLKGVDIDADFFNNTIFQSLEDFSVPLPKADIGVSNPFAPF